MVHVDPAAITAVVTALVAAEVTFKQILVDNLATPLFDASDVVIPVGVLLFLIHHMLRHGGEGARTVIAEGLLAGGGSMAMLHVVKNLAKIG